MLSEQQQYEHEYKIAGQQISLAPSPGDFPSLIGQSLVSSATNHHLHSGWRCVTRAVQLTQPTDRAAEDTHQCLIYMHTSINRNLSTKVVIVFLLTAAAWGIVSQQLSKSLCYRQSQVSQQASNTFLTYQRVTLIPIVVGSDNVDVAQQLYRAFCCKR